MLVSVVSGGKNGLTKFARIAGDAREMYTFNVVLNVLLPVVHFATNVTLILCRAHGAIFHNSLYMLQQIMSPWKLKQFKI